MCSPTMKEETGSSTQTSNVYPRKHDAKKDDDVGTTTTDMGTGSTTTMGGKDIPFVSNLWRSAYYVVPRVCIPGTNMDISFTIATGLFMYCVNVSIEKILINFFGWPSLLSGGPELYLATTDATSSLVAAFHSSLLLPGLWFGAFVHQPYHPSESKHVAPLWWQDVTSALLQFTTGYMIYDFVYGICVTKWDATLGRPVLDSSDQMFLIHHLATIIYMTSTRIYEAGHQSAMMCMFLGEFTNPFFNTHCVLQIVQTYNLKDCCMGGWFSTHLSKVINLVFPVLFCSMRAIVGPIVCTHMTFNILFSKQANKYIPLLLRFAWVLMIWGVILGSIPWVQECWTMLQPYLGYVGLPSFANQEL